MVDRLNMIEDRLNMVEDRLNMVDRFMAEYIIKSAYILPQHFSEQENPTIPYCVKIRLRQLRFNPVLLWCNPKSNQIKFEAIPK